MRARAPHVSSWSVVPEILQPDLLGRFRVERRLGQGAYATVWLAVDLDLDALVAIKVLADNWSADRVTSQRFLDEARLLRRLDDPHIVGVYELGQLGDGRPYFVMPYADGGTLHERMRQRSGTGGRYPIDEAIGIGLELAECLEAIHALGVVHRDIKPSNVLFKSGRRADRMLLADFGIARPLAAAGRHTIAAGTPLYAAPEQMDESLSANSDHRGDVYSAAVILYEMVTGSAPYTAARLVTSLEPPPSVAALDSVALSGFKGVILKGLAANPADRWQTAREWADALASAALPGSVSSKRPRHPGGTVERLEALCDAITQEPRSDLSVIASRIRAGLSQPLRIVIAWTESGATLLRSVDTSALQLEGAEISAGWELDGDLVDRSADSVVLFAGGPDDPQVPVTVHRLAKTGLAVGLQVTVAIPVSDSSTPPTDSSARMMVVPQVPTTGDVQAVLGAAKDGLRDVIGLLRARSALLELEVELARPGSVDFPDLRDQLESIRLGAHDLEEVQALDLLTRGKVTFDHEAMQEATVVLRRGDPSDRLGASRLASQADLRRAALDGAARWRERASEPAAGLVVRRVAATVARAYEGTLHDLGG